MGVNAATTDDPNGDGRVNFQHFATSSDPLGSQGNEGKFRVLIHQLPAAGTPRVMTYTFPVRSFDSNTSPPRTNYGIYADQVNYYLEADQSLPVSRFLVIDELVPALDAGLPVLHPAWEYRTFFITNSIETLPLGFMQLRVEED